MGDLYENVEARGNGSGNRDTDLDLGAFYEGGVGPGFRQRLSVFCAAREIRRTRGSRGLASATRHCLVAVREFRISYLFFWRVP